MLGTVVGDMVGSVHEFRGTATKTKEFGDLFVDNYVESKTEGVRFKLAIDGHGHRGAEASHFTDDTVCSMAVAKWLLEGRTDFSVVLREVCARYPRCGYGGMFSKWVMDPNMKAYQSWGNGAPMRVGPVGWAAISLEDADDLAMYTAEVTHNHSQAIKGAQAVAEMIHLLRNKIDVDEALNIMLARLDSDGHYKSILNKTLDEIRPTYYFKVSSQDTVPQALLCLKEAISFEDSIRNAISLGGDADTLAAIVGSMAEPYFGIPEWIAKEALIRLNQEFRDIIVDFEKRFNP